MPFMPIDSIQTYYEYYPCDIDSTRTLVLIHDAGLDSSYWHSIISLLQARYSLLLYDLRGHGKSGSGSAPVSWDLLCKDLHELIRKLGLASVVLIGHGLGANLSARFATSYPTLIEKVVYISPPISGPADFLTQEFQYRYHLAAGSDLDILGKTMAKRIVLDPERAELTDRIAQSYKRVNRSLYFELLAMPVQSRQVEELAYTGKPALILTGELDPIFGPAVCGISYAYLSRATLFIVPAAANMPFIDQPHYTADWIDYFIQKQTHSLPIEALSGRMVPSTGPPRWLHRKARGADPANPILTVKCLHSFEVTLNGKPLKDGWNTRYAKNLLLYLVFHPTATREQICDALFPEMDVKKALGNLRVYLNHFAKLLETKERENSCFHIGRDAVRLLGVVECDLEELLSLIRGAQQERDPEMKYTICRQLLGQITAGVLPGFYDPFALALKEETEHQWVQLALWAAEHCCNRLQHEQAIPFLIRCLELFPEEESIYDRIIDLYANLGQERELRHWMRKKQALQP